jgi:2-amino-4-hydroxy-6-hydroxymethyldihydropteridine diphosphokinase
MCWGCEVVEVLPDRRYRGMRTAVALGSNLGDRLDNLRAARKAILGLSNVKLPILSSAIYETEPVDCEAGAGNFLNAVVEFEYQGDSKNLLEQIIAIEKTLGRQRDCSRNVSRTIDIDLLYCGDQQIDNERLQLPHPRMHLRKFVLQPLDDIQPKLILPAQTTTVRELLKQLRGSADVVQFTDGW